MAMNGRRIKTTGAERAAQFLLVMGEERAAEILRELSNEEVHKIGVEMTRIKHLDTEEVNKVLSAFLSECDGNSQISVAAEVYTRKGLVQALGEEAAEDFLGP